MKLWIVVFLLLGFGVGFGQSCIECCNQLVCKERPELINNKTLWYQQIENWTKRTNQVLEVVKNTSEKINTSLIEKQEKKRYIKQVEYDKRLAFEISKNYYVILGIDIAHAYVLGNIKREDMINRFNVKEDLLNRFDKTIKVKYV